MEDQGDEIGHCATFDDDCSLEWWGYWALWNGVGDRVREMNGRQACRLVVKSTEENEGDDGSDANDTQPERVLMH